MGGLSIEEREQARVARRRVVEENRRPRILDARQRTIGVDMQALEEQMQEKQRREEEAKRRDKEYDEMTIASEKEALRQAKEHARARAAATRTLISDNKARSEHRNSGIGLPDWGHAKDVSIFESTPGLSGAHAFAGEDPAASARRKQQQAQVREWAAEALARREAERAAAALAQRDSDVSSLTMLDQRDQTLKHIHDTKQSQLVETRELNASLARHKAERGAEERVQQERANQEEIRAWRSSFLAEDSVPQQSTLSPHRVIPYQYKGMPDAQVSSIWSECEAQVERHRLDASATREEERTEAEKLAQAERQALLAQRARQRAQREENQRLRVLQEQQRTEKLQKHKKELQELHENGFTPAFFAGFGTSSR